MTDAVTKTTSPIVRDDYWTDDATLTLIEAWGERYLQLNKGNLRQHHWQEVVNAVNHRQRLLRTDIQCKNRIDTVKKKYKTEKSRVVESGGTYISPWPFFQTLDALYGSKFTSQSPPPFPPTSTVPVKARTLKRYVSSPTKDSDGSKRKKNREEDVYSEAAEAIEKLGEIYERVERNKQRQMVGLEKQRMQFAKDLECHRMKMFVESELQIQKMEHAAAATTNGSSSSPSGLCPSSVMRFLYLFSD